MRLFIALPVAAPARDEIRRVIAELRREPWPVRWVNPEAIHLTLKFLGEVPTDAVANLTAALRAAGDSIHPVVCRTTRAGGFPSLERARVIWLGLEAPGTLELLADRIERGCAALGFPPEVNIFRPHITLGRVQQNARLSREAVERLERLSLESSFTGEELTLFESRSGSEGVRYHPVAEFSLVA